MAGGDRDRISKARLDALTDGVFAFAMTLLVLNLELPDDLHPQSGADLARAFGEHIDDLVVYVISFFVLARRWFGQARVQPAPEIASAHLARWTLIHLFFITMVPFSTQIVGRYDLPPAIWLYAANVGLAALAAVRVTRITQEEAGARDEDDGTFELGVFVGTAILSSLVAFVDTSGAMLVYVLNAFSPLLKRWFRAPTRA
jgi:uncharacterized membrane protein